MKNLALSLTEEADLKLLYRFQLDAEARFLAAFTTQDSLDEQAYLEKYSRFLTNPTINNQTIRFGGEIVGSIAKFMMDDQAEITYWIDRQFWGKGIATAALREFLKIETARPIFGRVAFDNFGSRRVLECCGFQKIDTDKGFANERQSEIEELIYKLN